MELVLGHREVDDIVDPTLCRRGPEGSEELQKWVRKDKTARMTIGLTLSDEMLENVSHTTTALDCVVGDMQRIPVGDRYLRDAISGHV